MFAPLAEVLPQPALAEAGDPAVRVDEGEKRSREVGERVCRRRPAGSNDRYCRAGSLVCLDRRLGLCGSVVVSRRLLGVLRLVCAFCRRCGIVIATCVFACCVRVVAAAS